MKIIISETFLKELRVINSNRYKIEKEQPLNDNETIRVYHGFHDINNAIKFAKYGFSGKEKIRRNFPYEEGNNPYGLFVSINLEKSKKTFSQSGVLVELNVKVSDLETPVWKGSESFFSDNNKIQHFSSTSEREKKRRREKYSQDDWNNIRNSSRPELANSIFITIENQALFIGDINPNQIKYFWVEPSSFKEGWNRISRVDFLKKYAATPVKTTKIFLPNDNFNKDQMIERFKKKYNEKSLEPLLLRINNVLDKKEPYDNIYFAQFFFPKQLKQIFGDLYDPKYF